jgi:hypothetical protein
MKDRWEVKELAKVSAINYGYWRTLEPDFLQKTREAEGRN